MTTHSHPRTARKQLHLTQGAKLQEKARTCAWRKCKDTDERKDELLRYFLLIHEIAVSPYCTAGLLYSRILATCSPLVCVFHNNPIRPRFSYHFTPPLRILFLFFFFISHSSSSFFHSSVLFSRKNFIAANCLYLLCFHPFWFPQVSALQPWILFCFLSFCAHPLTSVDCMRICSKTSSLHFYGFVGFACVRLAVSCFCCLPGSFSLLLSAILFFACLFQPVYTFLACQNRTSSCRHHIIPIGLSL